MDITITTDGRTLHGKPMSDLSEWDLRTPFSSPEFPYKNFEEHPLEKFSLWKDLQQSGLKSGLMKTGWIGVCFPVLMPPNEALLKVRLDLTKPQRREPYRFRFSELIKPKETIFDHSFKK